MKNKVLLQLFAVAFVVFELAAITLFSIEKVQSLGNTYYVATTGSNANPGTLAEPFATIQYALDNAVGEGDTLIIRGGTYTLTSSINFPTSGTVANPIIVEAYPAEIPDINGNNVATNILNIVGRSYITIRGLSIRNPEDMWANIENSDHITLEDMIFNNDDQVEPRNFQGVYFRYSDYSVLRNSNLTDWGTTTVSPTWGERGNDDGNLVRIVGDTTNGGMYNLIEGNTFGNGAQGAVLLNAPYNVVRNNTFNNNWQKGLYVGYFENPGAEPPGTIFEAIGNLIEGNQFIRSQEAASGHGGLGIEHTAIRSIIRNNVIRNSDQLGFITTVFCDNTPTSGCSYAQNDFDNRIYNNTVVNNGLQAEALAGNGIAFGGTGMEFTNHGLTGIDNNFRDSVAKNNIIYGNLDNGNSDPLQLNLQVTGSHNNPPYGGQVIAGNLVHNKESTLCVTGNNRCPVYIPGSTNGTMSVSVFNTESPSNFYNNVEIADSADPGFVTYDAVGNNFDLHLTAGSPAIDAGSDLTATANSGTNSNSVVVEDSYYFQSGYAGLIAADQLQIGDDLVTITAVDYSTHTITVNQNITWNIGEAVNLPYQGLGPDIGAYEFASAPADSDNPIVGPITYSPVFDAGAIDYIAEDSTYQAVITDSTSNISYCEQSINGGAWASATWTPDGGDPRTGVCSGAFGLAGSEDGNPYTVQLRGVDTASNVGSGSVSNVVIDALNPSAATTIAQATYDSGSFVASTINGTGSDSSSGVSLITITLQRSSDSQYWNGSTWTGSATNLSVTTSDSYATWTYEGIAAINFTEGVSYTVTPSITDNMGHSASGTADSFTFVSSSGEPDSPVVSVLIFTPSSVVSGTRYVRTNSTVSATITDPTSNISTCEYTVNNGTNWSLATWTPDGGDPRTGTCSVTFAYGGSDHGTILQVNMRGTDSVANSGTGVMLTATIDASNPAGSITIANTTYNPLTFNSNTISGTGSDTGSGLNSTTITIQRSSDNYYWNGVAWVSGVSGLPVTTSNNFSTWTYGGITSSNLTDAITYTILATLTDRVGNLAVTSSDTFVWDSTIPDSDNPIVGSTTFTSAYVVGSSTYIRETSIARATITDSTSNISGCDYSLNNGSSWTAATWEPVLSNPKTGTCSFAFNLSGASHGAVYNFVFRATDLASNIAVGSARSITIDASSPSTSVTISGANYSNKTLTTTTINGTSSDTGVGVSGVSVSIQRSGDNYYWNGTSWVSNYSTVPTSTNNGYATWNYAGISGSQFTNSFTYSIRSIAIDYVGHSTTSEADTFTWTTDTIPSITITANPSFVVDENTSVILSAVVVGGEAPLAYSWSGVCSGNLNQSTINLSQGQYTCTVKVTDAQGDEATKSAQVTFATTDTPVDEDPDTGTGTPTPTPTPVDTSGETDSSASGTIGTNVIIISMLTVAAGSLGGLVYLLLGRKKQVEEASSTIMDAFRN